MAATAAEDRSLIAQIAAHESWARTPDRSARTAPARAAVMARFEALVDPDGTLSPEERTRRAAHLRRAHYLRLARKSAEVRRARIQATSAAEAEHELDALATGERR